MPRQARARFVALTTLLNSQPDVVDPAQAVTDRRVHVNGRIITNPRALVPANASIRIAPVRPLRGETKLGRGLDALGVNVAGAVAADLGAAAGGFTRALLQRGARRVYAVDAGHGQLLGSLRQDPRVVNLERTNIADLHSGVIPDQLDLITMDLSYLPISDAIGQLSGLDLSPRVALVALIKPTFELRRERLVTRPDDIRTAIRHATAGVERHGWRTLAVTLPTTTGAHGAIESFLHAAVRAGPHRSGAP